MKEIGNEINFLSDNLDKQLQVYHNYETRANYTLGLSSALLAFSVGLLTAKPIYSLGLEVIILTSTIGLMLSLLTIKPPRFLRKKKQKESLFYHNKITNLSSKKYNSQIQKIINSRQKLINQYCLEIYNIIHYSIIPRKKFYQYIVPILVTGLTIGIALIILSLY